MTLPDVLAGLESLGVEVFAAEEGFHPVCLACDAGPSGRILFVLVSPDDVPALEAALWRRMEPEAR